MHPVFIRNAAIAIIGVNVSVPASGSPCPVADRSLRPDQAASNGSVPELRRLSGHEEPDASRCEARGSA